MNWFERYGIPGGYCVLLFAGFLRVMFGFPCMEQVTPALIGAAVAASIPIGYILVVFSQFLYYKVSPFQMNRIPWNKATGEQEKEEWMAEAKTTLLVRFKCASEQSKGTEQGRWVQEWFVKRTDVMAINFALIVATTPIAIVIALVVRLILLHKLSHLVPSEIHILIFALLLVGIFVILFLSNRLLTKQARYIAVEYLTALWREPRSEKPAGPLPQKHKAQ